MEERLVTSSVLSIDKMPFSVDYRLTLKEILTLGKYQKVNPDIRENNFPYLNLRGIETANFGARLFHFNRLMMTEDILEFMGERNIEPAPIRELLFMGKMYPKLQRKFSIIGLGSTWKRCGDLVVPGLSKNHIDFRTVELYNSKAIWPSSCRFLGIQKLPG